MKAISRMYVAQRTGRRKVGRLMESVCHCMTNTRSMGKYQVGRSMSLYDQHPVNGKISGRKVYVTV